VIWEWKGKIQKMGKTKGQGEGQKRLAEGILNVTGGNKGEAGNIGINLRTKGRGGIKYLKRNTRAPFILRSLPREVLRQSSRRRKKSSTKRKNITLRGMGGGKEMTGGGWKIKGEKSNIHFQREQTLNPSGGGRKSKKKRMD